MYNQQMRTYKPRGKLTAPVTNSAAETYTVDELAAVLGLSRLTVYAALRAGTIPAIRLNRLWVLPKAGIQEWLKTCGGKIAA